MAEQERNLVYVAYTRAKHFLGFVTDFSANSGYEDGKNTEIYKPIAQSHRKNTESIQLLK